MNRLTEELKSVSVYAPKAVSTASLTTTDFVDVSGIQEVVFQIAAGSLAKDKSLTVQLVASDVAAGTGAVKIAEQMFTAEALTSAPLAVVSYKPSALHGRYIGIKFKHDAGSDVICGVTAQLRQREIPAENSWVMQE